MVCKEGLGLDLQSSHLILNLWEFAVFASCFPVFLSNLPCLQLENYQVGRALWQDLINEG